MQFGTLYLVPTPLDFGCNVLSPLETCLPQKTIEIAAKLGHWVCENAKSHRAFLKRIHELTPLQTPLQSQMMVELPREAHKKGDHQGAFNGKELLQMALNGHDMGLACEAGMPAIADPGSSVVRAAHALGIQVRALVGPNSLMLALASSGMNGQNFSFVGYLPQAQEARLERIRYLDQWARKSLQTQIFIETPYRNQAMLESLLQTLSAQTRLAIACGLGLAGEHIESHLVQVWRERQLKPELKAPCIFLLGT
jgi:16S rRNA (cytidine1402-2'-O)-methyltransferase